MKKIFMGLIAVSTISIAAQPVLGNAQDGTNVWETGSQGKILVNGKVTSTIPVVRYVVYASADGSYATAEDKLVLPDFVISQSGDDAGFAKTPNKIYVKRVNTGHNDVEELQLGDDVSFKIDFASMGYSTIWFTSDWFNTKNTNEKLFTPFQFFTLSKMQQMISGIPGIKINNKGHIYSTDERQIYKIGQMIHYFTRTNGILEFENYKPMLGEGNLAPETVTAIETVFAAGKPFTEFSILVKVD